MHFRESADNASRRPPNDGNDGNDNDNINNHSPLQAEPNADGTGTDGPSSTSPSASAEPMMPADSSSFSPGASHGFAAAAEASPLLAGQQFLAAHNQQQPASGGFISPGALSNLLASPMASFFLALPAASQEMLVAAMEGGQQRRDSDFC